MPPHLAALLLATDPTVFTWVDVVKIFAIPLVFLVLNRLLNRRDKLTDEQRGKKEAEVKNEREATKTELKRLADEVRQFVGKETLDTRFSKIEAEAAKQDKRMEGFQVQAERMADDNHRRFQAIESQMGEVGQLRADMAAVKAELKHFAEGFRDINNKLDMLLQRQMK